MKRKRTFASAVALLTAASLMAGCSGGAASSASGSGTASTAASAATGESGASGEFEPMTIAYAYAEAQESTVQLQNALDNVIGPALNIEFIYSEPIKDAGALTTFIENAYASGADAVYTNSTGNITQAAAVCEDLGLYFAGISSTMDNIENRELPHFVTVAGASAEGYGNSYAKAIDAVVNDGQEHSILILSGAASYGATSFIEGTAGSLRALQDIYGLTYTQDINTLATSATQVDAENDKGIKITIVPGMGDLTTTVSPLLQTGDYDVLVGTGDFYSSLGVVVNEVEEALDMDIKFINRTTFSDATSTAFNTTDSQGSPVMDAIVCTGTYENLSCILALRSAFDGYADNMRDNGACSNITGMEPLVITNAEDYNVLAGEDMPYSFVTTDELVSLCGPDVTWQDINDFGKGLTTESIIAKFAG